LVDVVARKLVSIKVELELLVTAVPGVKISVQDSGQGLPDALLLTIDWSVSLLFYIRSGRRRKLEML
jgi:hypothetical protein